MKAQARSKSPRSSCMFTFGHVIRLLELLRLPAKLTGDDIRMACGLLVFWPSMSLALRASLRAMLHLYVQHLKMPWDEQVGSSGSVAAFQRRCCCPGQTTVLNVGIALNRQKIRRKRHVRGDMRTLGSWP